MTVHLPLPALLSQVLVAFTIECDNEFEHQMPHRTTNHGRTASGRNVPWLVSLVMWSNCLQFVDEEGVTLHALQRLARTDTNLAGMQRWGYIVVEPEPTSDRTTRSHSSAVVRATPAGRKAREVWRPLPGMIEQRWRERFGNEVLDHLREALWALLCQCEDNLPDCLPILGYGLFSKKAVHEQQAPTDGEADGNDSLSRLTLPTLLSRVLLTFAIEFERESDVSLAISANVLRVLEGQGVRVQDLPRRTGVSKEAIAMSVSFLEKRGYVVVAPEAPGSRRNVLLLTAKGKLAQEHSHYLVWAIEERWQARFGKDTIRALREVLEQLVGEPGAQSSSLFKGLEPYPDGWRASVRQPDALPHYPMVLHRGGFPDGS